MNPDAPPQPDAGLDAFTNLFGKLNVESILTLSNGFAFLALLLAAILIAMSVVRGRTETATSHLIRNFLFVAMFFVVATIAVDVVRIFAAGPASSGPISLRIAPVSIQEMEEKFPIYVVYNGEEKDVFTSPIDATLSSNSFIMINANVVAGRLEKKTRQISELTKTIEAAKQQSTPTTAPVIDFTGG
jgi:hypothetical protein